MKSLRGALAFKAALLPFVEWADCPMPVGCLQHPKDAW
jgi:hypothetical protein